MKTILVTGGCGYIGSHTIVDLIENGYHVVSADNNSRSSESVLQGIKKITGVEVKNYKIDLCCFEDTYAVFRENNISGVIHFAAYKAVGESVENPLMYYENNLNSLINILKCAVDFKVPHIVFSSSCTVYGSPDQLPVTEESPLKKAESPYGSTKQMGEEILQQTVAANKNMKTVLLRYFNPAGAHPSCAIGELPIGKPQNLVPAITQSAIGKISGLKVWGSDYQTKDGTCIRDYIHVCDIAAAHTLAIKHLEKESHHASLEVFNLGSGSGYTVLEMIRTFEKANDTKADYEMAARRPGDVEAIYANNSKARNELNWQPQYTIDDIMATAWAWEKKLKETGTNFNNSNAALN